MAETVKHTPGPWFAHWNGHYHTIDVGPDDNDPSVAHVHLNHVIRHDSAEVKANANLISAAPEMLSALHDTQEELRDILPGMSDEEFDLRFGRISAAIAKAEGRS